MMQRCRLYGVKMYHSRTTCEHCSFKVKAHNGLGVDEGGAMRDECRAWVGEKGEARDDSLSSTLRRHISYATNVRDAELRDTVRGSTKVEQSGPGLTQQSRRVLRGPHLHTEDRWC